MFRVSVGHRRGSRFRTDYLFFGRYTLKPLQGSGPFTGKYEDASAVHKLRRMNLALHDGSILGLFGKSIMFLASLIGASLPITGFVIWHRKNRRKAR
ncbi:PepSY domain-containing protein [Bacteroides pyogenes]|uniref:PepSY domain-containing protein n=1 Tax=Bacteroides pyogenes TaxID=310300 RepID=UPI001F3BE5D0|nr:PepSY-associated TM helix domain-containing protein [Bacteroides pyogenes]